MFYPIFFFRFFLFLNLVFILLALLSLIPAPYIWLWLLKIGVTEFGQWLALGSLATVLTLAVQILLSQRADHSLQFTNLILASCALILLSAPSFRARRLARELGADFSVAELFSFKKFAAAAVEEIPFAGPRGNALNILYYSAAKPQAPVIVMIHGGGWNNGTPAQLAQFNHYLTTLGFAVFSVTYSFAPGAIWPAQREDVLKAIDFIRSRSEKFSINPDSIVVAGRSAGGQIALSLGLDHPPPFIKGVISLYGPADLIFAYQFGKEGDILKSPQLLREFLGGPPDTHRENFTAASPYLRLNLPTIPTLLIHGTKDELVWVKQSQRLSEKLRALNQPVEFLELPWATHGFDANLHGPSGQLARAAIADFLGKLK